MHGGDDDGLDLARLRIIGHIALALVNAAGNECGLVDIGGQLLSKQGDMDSWAANVEASDDAHYTNPAGVVCHVMIFIVRCEHKQLR